MFGKAIKGMTNAATTAINTAKSSVPAAAPASAPMPTGSGSRIFRSRMAARNATPTASTGFKTGGSVGSASKRADGVAKRGKTKGTFV